MNFFTFAVNLTKNDFLADSVFFLHRNDPKIDGKNFFEVPTDMSRGQLLDIARQPHVRIRYLQPTSEISNKRHEPVKGR